MYSRSAALTVSFFVRSPPTRTASSSSLSSIARLVGMQQSLHIAMCGARGIASSRQIAGFDHEAARALCEARDRNGTPRAGTSCLACDLGGGLDGLDQI